MTHLTIKYLFLNSAQEYIILKNKLTPDTNKISDRSNYTAGGESQISHCFTY